MSDITLNINQAELVNDKVVSEFYDHAALSLIASQVMTTMISKLSAETNLTFPYFTSLTLNDWQKTIELDVYITDPVEGQALNNESRQKNYATNILSYPSDLPVELLSCLPSIMLGELVICHHVVEKQAIEQNKSVIHHLTHLIVHGMLHLLGFDHELGEEERIQMESFEIEILTQLNIANPYES